MNRAVLSRTLQGNYLITLEGEYPGIAPFQIYETNEETARRLWKRCLLFLPAPEQVDET